MKSRGCHIPGTLPPFHHTITSRENEFGVVLGKLIPLPELYQLGLVPLVKEIDSGNGTVRVLGCIQRPTAETCVSFRLRQLKLERLDISIFIPETEQYSGRFLPALRLIALFKPCCTP